MQRIENKLKFDLGGMAIRVPIARALTGAVAGHTLRGRAAHLHLRARLGNPSHFIPPHSTSTQIYRQFL